MKKSILLNEDEKNRILNLHETAKNLYENKKPISQIKESNSKKENMKKVIKLTESDLEKIVRRVIKESMSVGFGAEPNGFRIKKMETKEQSAQPANPSMWTPQLGKTIAEIGDKNLKSGREYFMVPQTPTIIYNPTSKSSIYTDVQVFMAQTLPINSNTFYPPAIVGLGNLDINPPSTGSGPASNQMGTAYSITTNFFPRQYPGDEDVWPSILPKEMVSAALTAAYNKLDDNRKTQIQKYVQANQKLPAEYKKLIQGLAA